MLCAKNRVTLEPKQICPPRLLFGQHTQSPVEKWSQNPSSASDELWNFWWNVLFKPAYVNLGSNSSFEADMSIESERLFPSEHEAAFSPERNRIQNWSSSDGSLKHNDAENPGEQLCANSHSVDSFHKSQHYNLKPAEIRARKDLLVQYTPKISDEESQQISESTQSIITPLFEKRLSASDVSKYGRLVIPKKCAELQAGDTVSFGRREPQGKLILGFKKATTSPQSDQDALAVKNGYQMVTTNDVGSRSRKLMQELITNHSKVNKATGWSSSIPVKRKNSMVNFKRKHSRVDNMDFVGLKVTLQEAQGLFRSPLNHAPRVVKIEEFEFEEYEDAPVIGRPTIVVRDTMGKDIQWTQCDSCLKWRKLPYDFLLPARFTCSDNVWNSERSSCEIAQELSLKQLKGLVSINTEPSGGAVSKKLPDVELDVHASEDSKALSKSTIEVDCSSQLTTKHPRHKNGCSCVVCCQPPGGGPKHQPNCICKICMMRKQRLQTFMIRREKIQSKKGVIQKGKSQATMQINQT